MERPRPALTRPLSIPRVTALLGLLLAGFSALWTRGALMIDGPGHALYVRLVSDYLLDSGRVPYWLPDIWAGSPVWQVAPSFPLILLVPVAMVTSPDVAIKVSVLLLQVAGGVGAYVLARSLWGTRVAPVVSAIVYTLHPMIVSHGALLGGQGVLGVTAATPWLAWALRKALRGDGRRYVVASGGLAAFAVLHQAEYALALVPLCSGILFVELAAVRKIGWPVARKVVARMVGVVAVALGLAAHWILPFAATSKSFALSPPELVEGELRTGLADTIGREIGLFFQRPPPLHGAVSFNRSGLVAASFYLGLVCLALTAVTIVLISRRRGHAHLTAILFGSAFVVWLSTGPVALVSSGPALRAQVIPLAIAGVLIGLLVGGFVRHIESVRARALMALAAVALLISVPFVTPFIALQEFVPLLEEFRFPRFYMLAVLGLALGSGFPLVLIEQRLRAAASPRLARVPQLAGIAVVVLFVVDILPLASHYRVHPPLGFDQAYAGAGATLAAGNLDVRVASSTIDPRSIGAVLRAGGRESVGWPHPLAGSQLWRLTNETYSGPQGYREAALGLSATALVTAERVTDVGRPNERIVGVELLRNPRFLPVVRSYEQAVVVDDAELAPLLATSLAYRNVGVATLRSGSAEATGMPTVTVRGRACAPSPEQASAVPLIIRGEIALACAVDGWIARLSAGTEQVAIGTEGTGASFSARSDGLRGVAVWLTGTPGSAELTLYELGADATSLGRAVAVSQAVGVDEYGLTAFTFDPVEQSAGRRYAFLIRCDGCGARMVTGVAEHDDGDVLAAGRTVAHRVGAFTPLHDRVPPASVPTTRVTAERGGPGSWNVVSEGTNPSLLVVAETWFPGWKARVDGRPATVLQADGAFLGVLLEPGRHNVRFSYHRPPAAVAGRLVTLGTLGAVGFMWWRARQAAPSAPGRRRRRFSRLQGYDLEVSTEAV